MLIEIVNSIREFCDLDTPIFMFDKNGDFIVLRLEQVYQIPASLAIVNVMLIYHSSYLCLLDRKLYPREKILGDSSIFPR